MALLIDTAVLFISLAIFIQALALSGEALSSLFGFLGYLLGLFVFFGYPILMEIVFNGRTLGKMATRIRVTMADGSPITPGAALTRNLLRVPDFMPSMYLVGLLAIFFTEKQQRLGDLVANTVVIHERRNWEVVPLNTGLTEQAHPLEALVGELRGMTEDEYIAIKSLCDRFPTLPAHAQIRLTKEVWRPIANRLGIPEFTDVHPAWLMEAVVMKYARKHGML